MQNAQAHQYHVKTVKTHVSQIHRHQYDYDDVDPQVQVLAPLTQPMTN